MQHMTVFGWEFCVYVYQLCLTKTLFSDGVSLALDHGVMLPLQSKIGSVSSSSLFFSFLEQLGEELVLVY